MIISELSATGAAQSRSILCLNGVLLTVLMSMWAVGSLGVSGDDSISSEHIFLVSNYFEVIGIGTTAISAQMVRLKSFWDLFCVMIFPREASNINVANLAVNFAHEENSVSGRNMGTHPIPAPCDWINSYLLKEAFHNGLESWRHYENIIA